MFINMKKAVFTFLIITCLVNSLFSQSKTKFVNLLQASYMPGIGSLNKTYNLKNNGQTLSLRYTGTVSLNTNFTIGGGLGIESYTHNNDGFVSGHFNLTPLIAEFRYHIDDINKGLSLYADPGYAVKIFDDAASGFTLNTGVSYRFPLKATSALQATLGYNFQKINNNAIAVNINAITIGFGFVF